MSKKNQMLLLEILSSASKSLTSLMKLSYLIDLAHYRKTGSQISEYTYVRYRYGPFDSEIYSDLKELESANKISTSVEHTKTGDETIIYEASQDENYSLTTDEQETIDAVLESLAGYGAKALTELTYKTSTMVALGATLGGDENLNAILDLNQ